MAQFEPILAEVPEVASTFIIAGVPEVTRGIAVIRLKPWEERERSQQEIATDAAPAAGQGRRAWWRSPSSPPSLGQDSRSPPVQLVLQTSGSYEELADVTDRFVRAVEDWPGITDVTGELTLATPQLEVDFDRQKIADLGLNVDSVGRTLECFLAGRTVTRFNRNAEQYDVIVQVADADRKEPDDLAAIYVRGRGGEMIQLSNLVELRETVAAKELTRFNQLRSATVTAALAPGYTIGQALEHFTQVTAREVLPDDFRFDYSGPSREFKQAGSSILLIFGLGAGLHLPPARGPVRELPLTAPDHGDRAAVDGRRPARHAPHRRHAQRLQPDRAGDPDRPDHQARHPDRRVRQQGLGRGREPARRRPAGGRAAPAPDPDDHGRHGAGRRAAGPGRGRRCRERASRSAGSSSAAWRLGTLLTLFVLPALYAALPERRSSGDDRACWRAAQIERGASE